MPQELTYDRVVTLLLVGVGGFFGAQPAMWSMVGSRARQEAFLDRAE